MMTLYRITAQNMGNDENILNCTIYLDLEQFKVIRETQCFYIIKINGKEKRVGKNSKNQFGSPTKEKALINAYHRNNMYRSILNAKIKYAEKVNEFIKSQLKTKS